jgi:protein ImuA
MDDKAMARARLGRLRHTIARIEGRPAQTLGGTVGRAQHMSAERICTGIAAFDDGVGGGLQRAALTELRTSQTRHGAHLLGFALCLASLATREDGRDQDAHGQNGRTNVMPLLWVSAEMDAREVGLPYLPGMTGLTGLPPGRLLTAAARTLHDALWIAEEAAASAAFSTLIIEVRGNPKALGLDETRRLQRRAALSGQPVFLLRVAGEAEPTAAPCRLSVAPAPSVLRRTRDGPLLGSIGAPAFTVTVEKASAPPCPPFLLEWNPDERHFAHRPFGQSPAHSQPRPATFGNGPDRPAALGQGMAHKRAS